MKNIESKIYKTVCKVNWGYSEYYKPIIEPQYPIGNKKCSNEIDEVPKTDGPKKDKNSPQKQNNCILYCKRPLKRLCIATQL